MPNCPTCNHANPATSSFCSSCGSALDNDPPNPYADLGAANETPPEGSLDEQLLALMQKGQKVPAIKAHREATGSGLKESKDYVEALAARHGIRPAAAGCAGMLLLAAGLGAAGAAVVVQFV